MSLARRRGILAETQTTASVGVAYGISYGYLVGGTDSIINGWLGQHAALNSPWARFEADQAAIQPGHTGSFQWTTTDYCVNECNTLGLNVLMVIDDSSSSFTPPSSTGSGSNWYTYVQAVVNHYVPLGVTHYEIWNEPNIPTFWNPAASYTAYTTLLQNSYTAAKAAQPSCTILSAGLAPASTGSGNYSQTDFLSGMYASGAQGSMDIVCWHPYTSSGTQPSNTTGNWSLMTGTGTSCRTIMVANGDSAKKIWITEFGGQLSGDFGVYTEATQAQLASNSVALVQSTPYIGGYFWYTMQSDTNQTDQDFGLIAAGSGGLPSAPPYTSLYRTSFTSLGTAIG